MTDEVLARIEGKVGRITLNRPQALHALTTAMCRANTGALPARQYLRLPAHPGAA